MLYSGDEVKNRATLRQLYQYLTLPYYVLLAVGVVSAMFSGILTISSLFLMREILGEIQPGKSGYDTASKSISLSLRFYPQSLRSLSNATLIAQP
jgi:hypothetical protein